MEGPRTPGLDSRWRPPNPGSCRPARSRTLSAAHAVPAAPRDSAWGYWVTDGLGVYELLRLSELLGCASQLSIYTGYSMGAAYVPLNRGARFAADAVDLLEFANGDAAATAWGARRAAMGHAAPFGLRRLEVGNAEQLGRKGPPALSVGKRPAWTV